MNRAKTYHTKQQQAILDFLAGNYDDSYSYVTANQIMTYLREQGQSVGLTTVYRHLDKFEKEGIVHKIVLDGNSGACYQYAGTDENCLLLKCEGCGGIIPMDCSHLPQLYQHVLQEHQFQVNPHRTMFYGTCGHCLAVGQKWGDL